jgi:hypothetical protein
MLIVSEFALLCMKTHSDSVTFQEMSSLLRQQSHLVADKNRSVRRRQYVTAKRHLHKQTVRKFYDMWRLDSFKLVFDFSKFITLIWLRLLLQILTEECEFENISCLIFALKSPNKIFPWSPRDVT